VVEASDDALLPRQTRIRVIANVAARQRDDLQHARVLDQYLEAAFDVREGA
jgi:hypothetical protein